MAPKKTAARLGLAAVACLLWGIADAAAAEQPETAFQYESGGKRDPFVPLVRDGKIIAPVSLPTASARGGADLSLPILAGILWLIITPGFWIGTGGTLGWIFHIISAYTAYSYARDHRVRI